MTDQTPIVAEDTQRATNNRQVIPLVAEDVTLEQRRARLAVNMASLYLMRPVYQWLGDLVSLIAQSDGLGEIAALLAYSTAQSAINPTNASVTLWHMSTTDKDEEIRLRQVISAVQTYRTPDNMAEREISPDDFMVAYGTWLELVNPDKVELFDLPQLLMASVAAMQANNTTLASWVITHAGQHEENKNYFNVTLQRWDIQMDILINFHEVLALASMIQLFRDVDAEDAGEQLPEPPAEVIVH